MRLLVDSNIVSFVLKEREPVLRKLSDALAAGDVFFASDVVDYETRR